MICEDRIYHGKPPELDAVNPVGCGDSMTAGFAAGFSRGLAVAECIRLASAISAASAMRMETGYFLKQDMEALLPRIEVHQIA